MKRFYTLLFPMALICTFEFRTCSIPKETERFHVEIGFFLPQHLCSECGARFYYIHKKVTLTRSLHIYKKWPNWSSDKKYAGECLTSWCFFSDTLPLRSGAGTEKFPSEHFPPQPSRLEAGTEIELVAFFFEKIKDPKESKATEYYYFVLRVPSHPEFGCRLVYFMGFDHRLLPFPWKSGIHIPEGQKFTPADIFRFYPDGDWNGP